MTNWSLSTLFESLHDEIQESLARARKSMGHSVPKGDASEYIWIDLFTTYLPDRYRVERAFIVDSDGSFSDQIDVVIFDRQYSPFIFNYKGQIIIPAESVYAVFESKQTVNAQHIKYTQEKITSVRNLHRTSLPIPHAGGTYQAKEPMPIYGGILAFESDWEPALDEPLNRALNDDLDIGRLDIGCVAAHGHFIWDQENSNYNICTDGKAVTSFLLDLFSLLQQSGTVSMIDIQSYAKWL